MRTTNKKNLANKFQSVKISKADKKKIKGGYVIIEEIVMV